MNILVLGNGFDLAHGLPTRYINFLIFCKIVDRIYSSADIADFEIFVSKEIKNTELSIEIKEVLYSAYKSRKSVKINDENETYETYITNNNSLNKLFLYIVNNFWIEYFTDCSMGDNWIDFESEISKVVQILNEKRLLIINDAKVRKRRKNSRDKIFTDIMYASQSCYGLWRNEKYILSSIYSFDKFVNSLERDLRRLICALEIYLAAFVDKVKIDNMASILLHNSLSARKYDHVLSFNYTNTYEKLYGKSKHIMYDYIHGKASLGSTLETNNMVLGIDEYLSDERKDKDIAFIAFKKFYQRMHKQTGCNYKSWVDEIKLDYSQNQENIDNVLAKATDIFSVSQLRGIHTLAILGHSLDVTDKDILKDLILNDNVCTTIYYHNHDAYGKQIANLVKVIGQDELIKRTGGRTKTIEFKLQ